MNYSYCEAAAGDWWSVDDIGIAEVFQYVGQDAEL